uniref:Uncharacterized protein n=1 Tax=Oryza sativa subsp. japonica TaxID=39947 RepID=Q6H6F0_ORYSJ|nr:hypothetical protein [Oryza sativa Japonica Group]
MQLPPLAVDEALWQASADQPDLASQAVDLGATCHSPHLPYGKPRQISRIQPRRRWIWAPPATPLTWMVSMTHRPLGSRSDALA